MKVSKRDVMIILGFLGILAAVLSYVLVFTPTMEKADAIEEENSQLQARISDLSSKVANKSTYESETQKWRQEMADIYQVFPVDVREENAILLAINQELISPMVIDGVIIDPLEDVPLIEGVEEEDVEYTYGYEEIEQLEAEQGISNDEPAQVAEVGSDSASLNPLGLKTRKMTMNYEVSYEGLKRSIRHLCMQTERMTINEVAVAYDESTGLLQGATTVDMYCVPGQMDKEYVEPDFNYVLLGTHNIFGTITVRSEADLEDIEGEDVEGAEE